MVLYPGHIPTNSLQKVLLTAGSAVAAIYNPYRHDMVAVCGETSGRLALRSMFRRMQEDSDGQDILKEQPRINSSVINISRLRELPDHTLGFQYVRMLDSYGITPDTRMPVRFVDDKELAYVMQRYREIHDFNHLILGQPTNMLGEVVVKWFEALQTGLPMCYMAALAGPARLSQKRRRTFYRKWLPWVKMTASSSRFFMNVYYEKRFEENIDDIRKELGINIMDCSNKQI